MDQQALDQFTKLIGRKLSGNLTPEEERDFQNGIDQNEEKHQLYSKYHTIWKATGSLNGITKTSIAQEWNRLALTIEKEEIQKSRFSFIQIAATIVILLSALFAAYYSLLPQSTELISLQSLKTETLADNSEITLNSNSVLVYNSDFNRDNRTVELTGEAFFDITPNKALPFIIKTGPTEIKVVGTSFNVNSYDDTDKIEVTVTSGVVTFSNQNTTITLHPGDVGYLDKKTGTLIKNINKNINYLAWKTHKIQFNDTPIKEATALLANVYHQKIEIEDSSTDCLITGKFDNQTLDDILNIIRITFDASTAKTSDSILISDIKC